MAGIGTAHLREPDEVILRVEDLVVEFKTTGGTVHAVSGISFDLIGGETLGILGESGCGKSSAGRAVMQLPPPTSGSVVLQGEELTGLGASDLRRKRAQLQMIFQDPVSSLNPRRRVMDLVAEGTVIRGRKASDQEVRDALKAVGLDPEAVWDRRPHELSGGQCQRVCIARALMLDPKVLICDEPVSSLDVSVQAQILNLLEETKKRYALSLVFVAHDLAVVKNISDRILIMYLGKICEVVTSDGLALRARHPYTRLLLESVPATPVDAGSGSQASAEVVPPAQPVGPDGTPIRSGPVGPETRELPSPLNPPSGCRFRTRCPLATERCAREEPLLREVAHGQFLACHNVA